MSTTRTAAGSDQQQRALLFETVLDALAHLIAGIDDRKGMVFPKTSIAGYDGFELFDPLLADDDDFILAGNDPLDLPVWPIDARWGNSFQDGWFFARVCTLDPKRWRGRLRTVLPRMCEAHETFIRPDGSAIGSVGPLGLTREGVVDALAHNHPGAGRVVAIGDIYASGVKTDDGTHDLDNQRVRLAQGIMLRREYLWSVLLGEAGVPRARFVTDPIGVREAFRLRDIPPGRQRRAALRHWVTQHWRKRRVPSEADEIFVREYLRGATDFQWNGLSCQVAPSRQDERRARAGH